MFFTQIVILNIKKTLITSTTKKIKQPIIILTVSSRGFVLFKQIYPDLGKTHNPLKTKTETHQLRTELYLSICLSIFRYLLL